MARITDTKTTKKYATITFEFEHNGKIHQRKSKLKIDTFWKLSDRELKQHIGVRANHERSKIDNSGKTPKKEEQKDEDKDRSPLEMGEESGESTLRIPNGEQPTDPEEEQNI